MFFRLRENGLFRRPPAFCFAENHCDIRPVEHAHAALDAFRTEFGNIVDSRGIKENDRTERQEFHRFFDHVGCRSGNRRRNRDVLSGNEVEKAGFAHIRASEQGYLQTE